MDTSPRRCLFGLSLMAVSILLASCLALTPGFAAAQDTLTIDGVTLRPGDSLKVREVLHSTPGPDSEFWTERHNKPGHYRATNTFMSIAEIAYPLDIEHLNPSHVDSILTYLETVATQHSVSVTQAEFLHKALSVAHQVGRTSAVQDYYERLISEYGQTHYAKRAEEYAPDRPIQVGKQLSSFEFPALTDTTEVHSKEEFRGQVVLLDFWGTWCGPCIAKMPQIHKAYRKYRNKGFEILSVAMHDERKDVWGFRSKEWEMPWNHAFIPEGTEKEKRVVSRFGVHSFPRPILIDKDGTIIATSQQLARKKLVNVLSRVFDKRE